MPVLHTDKLPTDAELLRMFDAVPKLERYKVADKVVRAGLKPITQRARQIVPRGNPADRKKRSKNQIAKHPGLNDPEHQLYKSIKAVIRKPARGLAYGLTGTELKGNIGQKVYFVAEHKKTTRRVVLWGKQTGRTVNKVRNIMLQAADETRSAQLSAMKTKLKESMDEAWKRG